MTKKELTTRSAALLFIVAFASTTLEHKKQKRRVTLHSLPWPLALQVRKKKPGQ
jgi:hypothetical protein